MGGMSIDAAESGSSDSANLVPRSGRRRWAPLVSGIAVLAVGVLAVGLVTGWRARQPDGCFRLELELAAPPAPVEPGRAVTAEEVLAQEIAISNQVGVTGPMVTVTADGRVVVAVVDPVRGVTGRRVALLSDRSIDELRACLASPAFRTGEREPSDATPAGTQTFSCTADLGSSALVAGPASGAPALIIDDASACPRAPTAQETASTAATPAMPPAGRALASSLDRLGTDVRMHGVDTSADPPDVRTG